MEIKELLKKYGANEWLGDDNFRLYLSNEQIEIIAGSILDLYKPTNIYIDLDKKENSFQVEQNKRPVSEEIFNKIKSNFIVYCRNIAK